MTDMINETIQQAEPTIGQIARQEFWIVSKAYFAPIYGSLLVLRHLLRATRAMDSSTARLIDAEATAMPAE